MSAGRVASESAAGAVLGGAAVCARDEAGVREGAGARDGSASWCVVDGRDLATALRGGAHGAAGREWPAVLRPAVAADPGNTRTPADPGSADDRVTPIADAPVSPGVRLCTHALKEAAASHVRSIHWFLHPGHTIIAEAAHGARQTVILVGRVPHGEAGMLDPGVLLLGVFAAAEAPARLSHLVGSGDARHPVSAVLSRWLLPAGAPVPPARVLRSPPAEKLESALVAQLVDALARAQAQEETVAQADSRADGDSRAGGEPSA